MFAVGETGLRKDMDGDNCLKCLIDALVEAQIIPDDNRQHVRGVGMEWVSGKEGVTAYISPAEVGE
jgi:Holliday junction resolvase RusA-like endonuclease